MNFAEEIVARLGAHSKPKPLDIADIGMVLMILLAFAAIFALEWVLGEAVRRALRRAMRRIHEEYWKANRK